MSAFGDHTYKQDLLEALEGVHYDHPVTFIEFMRAMLEVLAYIAEYRSDMPEYFTQPDINSKETK